MPLDFNSPSPDFSAQKEFRKKRLEELKRKNQLKKDAMDRLAQGNGAVSAGPHSFASNFEETVVEDDHPSFTSSAMDLPSEPLKASRTYELPVILPTVNTERRSPARTVDSNSFTESLEQANEVKLKPKYSIVTRANEKVSGVSASKAKKLKRNREQQWLLYAERSAWVFCGILCLRLLFADRGIVDYYSRKGMLDTRGQDYKVIHLENEDLIREIALLRDNPAHQKKIIRTNLGFIAEDEYLVLVE